MPKYEMWTDEDGVCLSSLDSLDCDNCYVIYFTYKDFEKVIKLYNKKKEQGYMAQHYILSLYKEKYGNNQGIKLFKERYPGHNIIIS